MKANYFVFFLLIMVSNFATAEQLSKYQRGVLKITTANGSGTGFVVKDGVVTALHVLLTDQSIKNFVEVKVGIQSEMCSREAVKLLKIDSKYDLALLSKPRCSGLVDFQTENHKKSSGGRLILSGYPDGLGVLLTGTAETTLDPYTSLKALAGLESKHWAGPDNSINVLSIDKEMLPGHSGAPLFGHSGRVVGVANGGRQNKPISWAIPWNKNIRFLSGDIKGFNLKVANKEKHGSKVLYSSLRAKKGILSIEFVDGNTKNIAFDPNSSDPIDLGRFTSEPLFIKNAYTDEVIGYDIKVDYGVSAQKGYASGANETFEFFVSRGHLLLKILPSRVTINERYIIDKKNKLMWAQQVEFMPWGKAPQYLASARRGSFLGFNDWRLPSQQDLRTLKEIAKATPGKVKFSEYWHWSTSKYGLGDMAYAINGGEVPDRQELSIKVNISESLPVRLVRNN